jgi:hypothetical protein
VLDIQWRATLKGTVVLVRSLRFFGALGSLCP